MSSEKIRGTIADFWHPTDKEPEATYTARSVLNWYCGECGIAISPDHWPSRCSQGHLNVRP